MLHENLVCEYMKICVCWFPAHVGLRSEVTDEAHPLVGLHSDCVVSIPRDKMKNISCSFCVTTAAGLIYVLTDDDKF